MNSRHVTRKGRKRDPKAAVAYVRCSTREQGDSGLGLAAQRAAIKAEAKRRGWRLVATFEDVASGSSTRKRPGLAAALEAVETGPASILIVSKLDRLSRSVVDTRQLLDRAQANGWGLAAIDIGLDPTSLSGKLVTAIMTAIAEWERDTISERTRDALAERKAEGKRLGRTPNVPAEVIERIHRGATSHAGWSKIARELNDDHVPTAQDGTRWYPSTVREIWYRHKGPLAS